MWGGKNGQFYIQYRLRKWTHLSVKMSVQSANLGTKVMQNTNMPILEIPSDTKRTFCKPHSKSNGIFLFQNRTPLTSVAILNVIHVFSLTFPELVDCSGIICFNSQVCKASKYIILEMLLSIKVKITTMLDMVIKLN